MRIRRFISVLLVMVMLAATGMLSYPVFAAEKLSEEKFAELCSLSLIPSAMSEDALSKAVTRGEMAYTTAKLFGIGTMENINTDFYDVDETTPYSGYIQWLSSLNVMNGSEGNFMPEGNVSLAMAMKVLVLLTGYEQLAEANGGYPNGYLYAGGRAGFRSMGDISDTDMLCRAEWLSLVYEALRIQTIDIQLYSEHGIVYEKNRRSKEQTILGARLGVNVYQGTVQAVREANRSLDVFIEKNALEGNPDYVTEGVVKSFSACSTLNISHFDQVPVLVYVKNEEILYMRPQNGVRVLYGFIDEVNRDDNEDSAYAMRYVSKISLMDDDKRMNVSADAVLSYNGEKTDLPKKLCGAFARIVEIQSEVVYIETWDFAEGGYITAVSNDAVSYMAGEQSRKLDELYQYSVKRLFIDGESRDWHELKPDSVFMYYKSQDSLILCVSERVVVDTLNGSGTAELEIGNMIYSRHEHVYVGYGDEDYRADISPTELLGLTVRAYFAPNGKIQYLKSDTATEETGPFYGFAAGVKYNGFGEAVEIAVWRLGQSAVKEIYEINRRTDFSEVSLSELETNSNNLNGDGLYVFETGSNNKLLRVARAESFYGFSDKVNLSAFLDSVASAYVGGKTLYFPNVPITAVYESNGDFTVKQVEWSVLQGRYCGGAQMAFYGKQYLSIPEVVVLSGTLDSIGSKARKYGVVTSKKQIVDSEENMACEITVLSGNSKSTYKITVELAETIPIPSFISYYDELQFSESELALYGTPTDLRDSYNSWSGTLASGTVEKIDRYMLFLTDGTAICFHPNQNFFILVNEANLNNRFIGGSVEDIQTGDFVYYNSDAEGIKGLLSLKH